MTTRETPSARTHVDCEPDLIAQRMVFGYGSELEDALARYYRASGAEAPGGSDEPKVLLGHFASWMEKCPRAEHVCFADFLFIPPRTLPTESLAFVITPHKEGICADGHRPYQTALNDFWGPEFEYALATHPQFQRGLPICQSGTESGVLIARLDEFVAPQAQMESTEALLHLAHKEDQSVGLSENFVATDLGAVFAKRSELTSNLGTGKSLSTVWGRWKETFSRHRTRLRSRNGQPLKWLIASPVGYRDVTDFSRYTQFAIVFLGFDAGLTDREDLFDAFRYVMLHLYESNATSTAAREGQAQGVTMRAEADAHETGRVIAAISSGLSDNVYHLVRDYLNTVIMGLDPYTPFDMTTRSLARQIEGLVTASTRIEFIVAATMREGGLAREPGQFDEAMAAKVKEVSRATRNEVPDDLYPLNKRGKKPFSLAVQAALRNAIRHSFFSKHRAPQLRIFVDQQANHPMTLVIENECLLVEEAKASPDKKIGTHTAIMGYVREYGDPALVVLAPKSRERLEADDTVRMVWETRVPFPRGSGEP